MTPRISARLLAGTASVAILVAACGSGTASTAPTAPPATPTVAPVTQAPVATSQGGQPTFDLSSFHAAVDLEKLIPSTIGGAPVTPLSMTGAELAGSDGSPELTAALASLNKSVSDVSAAFGFASGVSVIAIRVDGVSGSAFLTALFAAYKDLSTATITDASFGGKSVKKLTPVDPDDDVSYIYTSQDVVFAVGGSGATDALLNEVFSKLP